jgi:RNA polymerase sigma-70 factor (ECF subfamily)
MMEKQRTYLQPLSLDNAIEHDALFGSNSHLEQADLQAQVAQREEVQQALAQLTAAQRRVIALRYGADLTEVDIAQVLGWPVGTVKSRLNRARERLRELLKDEER